MTREDLIAHLDLLPPGTELFTRSGDNAWSAELRVFEGNGGVTGYFDRSEVADHRNFPEGYRGTHELVHPEIPESDYQDLKNRLARISGAPALADLAALVHCVEVRMAEWQRLYGSCAGVADVPNVFPRFTHEVDPGTDVVALGGYSDPQTGKYFDLYFRPKPKDSTYGFTDEIIARWGNGKHDFRMGTGETYTLGEIQADVVLKALRVGMFIARDLGLMP